MSSPLLEKASRVGWREFDCWECGHAWKETSRDCHSPSKESCPVCFAMIDPTLGILDSSIPVNKWGNLLEHKIEHTTPLSNDDHKKTKKTEAEAAQEFPGEHP